MATEERPIETAKTVELVEAYVYRELHDAKKYDNRSPLDNSGIYSLHELAARIYQLGFNEGRQVEARRNDGEHLRRRESTDA